MRSIRESFLDQPVSVSRCEAGEPSSIPGAHSFASFCMAMGDFCMALFLPWRCMARVLFAIFGWERGGGCMAPLCTLSFSIFSAWSAFVLARRVCACSFFNFFGLALIWNKKTDVWVTRGSIYALASTTSLPCFFLARLAWLLLLSLFIRHGLASSSTPSTL